MLVWKPPSFKPLRRCLRATSDDFVTSGNWQSNERADATQRLAKCADVGRQAGFELLSQALFFFILHTAVFLCTNECNTTNAFGEGLSKTMCHLRMIHASSLMIMAFAIVMWLLNSNICAPRPTRSHPRLSNTESALSHPSASHTDAQGTLWCLCAARKLKSFLPESFSKIFNV